MYGIVFNAVYIFLLLLCILFLTLFLRCTVYCLPVCNRIPSCTRLLLCLGFISTASFPRIDDMLVVVVCVFFLSCEPVSRLYDICVDFFSLSVSILRTIIFVLIVVGRFSIQMMCILLLLFCDSSFNELACVFHVCTDHFFVV